MDEKMDNLLVGDKEEGAIIPKTGVDNSFLLEEMTRLSEEIAYLRDLFVRRLNEDKQKSVAFQKLSEGATYAFIEPFLHDVILLLDRLEKSDDDFVLSVKEELYDIIHRRGVEIVDVSGAFNPTIHKAVKAIENPSIDQIYISDVIRNGYMLSNKVIRPAEVVVSKPEKINHNYYDMRKCNDQLL